MVPRSTASNAAPPLHSVERARQLDRLRAHRVLQDAAPTATHIPVTPSLSAVLPAGLRRGASYQVEGSTWLLIALLARASAAHLWCAVVGVPDLGIEAAATAGLDLSRLVLIPTADEQWLGVTSHLLEAMTVVVVRPGGEVAHAVAARLAARQRRYGSVLLSYGRWPRAEAVVRLVHEQWHGVGVGCGRLRERTVRIEAIGKAGRATTTLDTGTALARQSQTLTPSAELAPQESIGTVLSSWASADGA